MLFIHPVSAFEYYVLNCLAPIAALAGVSVSLVDGMEIGAEANLAHAHLCDGRTNGPVCASMYCENILSWSDPKFIEVSALLILFPQ
jgi:hypothetical protein